MLDHRTMSQTPIYVGMRRFLGRKDLVVSFYTAKCQFQCTHCALPLRSSVIEVPVEDLNVQIDDLFDTYSERLTEVQQLSFGNEGSALDDKRFHTESLHHLLERTQAMDNLEVLSIETRPEYLRRAKLEDIRSRTSARTIDVTVGFETQDDHIRQTVLRKKISRRVMEDRISLLADLGMRLTSYIMVKPAPRMTEEQGVNEAIATMDYLAGVCAHRNVELVAYLTPTYIAKGSYLHATTALGDWVPPTIQSILDVVVAGYRMGIPVYSGLWSEGLADEDTDFRGRDGYDPALHDAIIMFNKANDFSHLDPFVKGKEGKVSTNRCAPTGTR